MKYIYSLLVAVLLHFSAFSQQQTVSHSISPSSFNETQTVTLTFNGSSINESAWGGAPGMALYLWSWSFDQNDLNSQDSPNNGSWSDSNEASKLTYNGTTDTYSITFIPKDYYNRTGIGRIGFLIKTDTGSGQSQDIFSEVVQLFNFNLTNPAPNSFVSKNPGETVNITATTSVPVTYNLYVNDTLVNTATSATSYSYVYTVSTDASVRLTATNSDNQTLSQSFNIIANRTVTSEAIPSWIRQGINYNADATKVGLALYAPHKTFVHVIGSFNNWARNDTYLMKRDTANPDLYWIELTGLTPQQVYTFQYLTNDNIRVADPFSPLVLSPYDDQWIEAADYPNLPAYPTGQNFEVSVVQTGMPQYNWTVPNFTKPAKENLIVYELLVRDFTSEKNWQSLIDKIPYLKSLNINAVELMPIMEFDGNNSWGYNTAFHYALDKAYGTQDKFKEFVDKCHQNGIAVILDIALNHATGRNPLVRLWANDPDGDGFGAPAANNPYFNQTAKHAYSVFEDFNHSSAATRHYVERVVEHWIKEYKIDGYRWDLTKGFTQNCTSGDEGCTGSYQQDRVDVLKLYADKQWSHDGTSFVIFEHLGGDSEEKEWANYRINEGKGVMMWTNLVYQYNQNTIGDAANSNFNRVDYELHSGFTERRALAYAESHDEERLMYRNLNFGKTNGSYNVKDLATALDRQEAVASVFLTVPGPKMIWQFGELGYDFSINRCENGTISNDCRTSPKPVAFALNYHNDANRKAVYDTWSKVLALRLNNEVFNTKTFTVDSGDLTPNIYIWRDDLPTSTLKNVVIIANFELGSKTITPNFPYAGTWYNLMDNSTLSVTDHVFHTVTLQPGEFRIFGNQKSATTESYTLSAKAASCSANDGEITITVNKAADYTATVTGTNYNQTYTFNSTKIIGSLPAGTYKVCISTAGGPEVCNDVTVGKDVVAAPTGAVSQTFLPGFTVADLSAAGNAVKWYAAATGGSALPANTVLENGKTYYASQTVNGCESAQRLAVNVTLDYNNFNIETKSETCAGKNNGEIIISANQSYSYIAKINGTSYNFTNNRLTVSNLPAGTYQVCITIPGRTFEQCYTAVIAKGVSLTGKISTGTNAVSVNINEDTAPFTVFVNGIQRLQTNDHVFNLLANQGDLIEVKTAVSCEGVLVKTITDQVFFGAASAYPNPTKGEVFVRIPTTDREVEVEVYSYDGRLVLKQRLPVINGQVKLDLTKYAVGVYVANVLLKDPVSIRIIKN